MASRALAPAHVGCSGWNYKDWRGPFYEHRAPARRWLELYAERFSTVEVNASFYRLVSLRTAERWVQQTPDDFIFAVKASRYLTHVKRLHGIADGVARFYAGIEPLQRAGRLGPVLWQLPADFKCDVTRLASALEALPEGAHAFEFRDPSWFVADVLDLLRSHGAALTIGVHPDRPFQTYEATAPWRYVRFHRGARGRRGNYSERELEEWAEQIDRWREQTEVFAYFNNDWEAFAPANASSLRRMLA